MEKLIDELLKGKKTALKHARSFCRPISENSPPFELKGEAARELREKIKAADRRNARGLWRNARKIVK